MSRASTPNTPGLLAQGQPTIVPSTPLAGMEILKAAGVELRGKHAVVVGRSQIVGRPLIQLLLAEHATVSVCHTRTPSTWARSPVRPTCCCWRPAGPTSWTATW